MTLRGRLRAMRTAPLLALALIALATLAGCGGQSDQERTDAAQSYADRVSAVSTKVGDQLGTLSERSDYRDGQAAAESTRAFATAIREAAKQLRAADPPEPVTTLHASLVALYAQTATELDQLATRFESASDPVELAARAQDLSSAIQRYATREQQVRDAIQRTLAAGSTTTP